MSNPRVATTANDGVLTAVGQVRRVLSRILWTRMLLQAAGVGVGSWLLLLFLRRGTSAIPMMVAITVSSIVALACLALLWRRLGVVTALRAALWIEEHGGSGYALVTWVEQSLGGSPSSPWLGHVVADASRTSLARARAALAPLARSQLAGPLGFVVGAALVAWGSAVAPERLINAIVASRTAGTRAVRAAPIGAWRVRVTPPAYSGLPVQELGDVTSVRALSGARIVVVGSDAVPDSVRTRELSDSAAATKHATKHATVDVVPDGWRSEIIATDGPLEARVTRDRFAKLLLVEGVPDSIPRVTLTAPVRDSVLRSATGRLPLVARMHDDIGLARASFEVVISSGEGERFTARTVEVGVQALRGAHDDTLRAVLDLAALQLGPGDVIHMRATARDAHPMAAREAGTSETRSFRVARPSEYDSVAVEPAPPPEVDKSLLSQRMLLMLTERLEARRPRLAVTTLREESRTLARDQGRLRQAVGDAVFQRLTGDAGGEHSHSADDGHDRSPRARDASRNGGDGFDLDAHVARQAQHGHRGPRRTRITKHARVHRIHGRELRHVAQKHGGLHDMRPGGARGLEHRREVGQDLFGLGGHVARHQFHRIRIERDLSRGEQESVGAHGLRIGADGLGSKIGVNRLDGHGSVLVSGR